MIKRLFKKIQTAVPSVVLNGPDFTSRSPVNLSLTFNTPVDLVLPQLAGLAFSQGSACSTSEATSSHVLKAIGLSLSAAQRTIRISIGRWTSEIEIDQAAETLIKVFKTTEKSVIVNP